MNIPNKAERLEKTLAVLKISLQESWKYFLAAISIENWLSSSNKQFEIESGFFYLAYDACIRSSISTLAELISKNKNATNLHYFLNIATDSLSLFKFAQEEDFRRSIQEQNDWLNKLTSDGSVGNRIIDKRDKMISHLDRKFATERNPGFISTNPPINSNEIDGVYKELIDIINVYEFYFYGSSYRQNELDMSAKDDFLKLIEAIH